MTWAESPGERKLATFEGPQTALSSISAVPGGRSRSLCLPVLPATTSHSLDLLSEYAPLTHTKQVSLRRDGDDPVDTAENDDDAAADSSESADVAPQKKYVPPLLDALQFETLTHSHSFAPATVAVVEAARLGPPSPHQGVRQSSMPWISAQISYSRDIPVSAAMTSPSSLHFPRHVPPGSCGGSDAAAAKGGAVRALQSSR